jgi:hypothetical protein
VFVLHSFQKKSKHGIATPKERYRHHSREAQNSRSVCKGVAEMKTRLIDAFYRNALPIKLFGNDGSQLQQLINAAMEQPRQFWNGQADAACPMRKYEHRVLPALASLKSFA